MGHDITQSFNNAYTGEFTKRVHCYDAAVPGIGWEEVDSTEAMYST